MILAALRRGISKRCPHCGEGPIFSGWAHHLERCPVCGLVYERNPGDTWAFTIIGDRLPIAAIIVLIYFGIGRAHPVLGWIAFGVLGLFLIWTAPNRWGAGIALHYLSRVYWPDPSDPVPRSATDRHECTNVTKTHEEKKITTKTPRRRGFTHPSKPAEPSACHAGHPPNGCARS